MALPWQQTFVLIPSIPSPLPAPPAVTGTHYRANNPPRAGSDTGSVQPSREAASALQGGERWGQALHGRVLST